MIETTALSCRAFSSNAPSSSRPREKRAEAVIAERRSFASILGVSVLVVLASVVVRVVAVARGERGGKRGCAPELELDVESGQTWLRGHKQLARIVDPAEGRETRGTTLLIYERGEKVLVGNKEGGSVTVSRTGAGDDGDC